MIRVFRLWNRFLNFLLPHLPQVVYSPTGLYNSYLLVGSKYAEKVVNTHIQKIVIWICIYCLVVLVSTFIWIRVLFCAGEGHFDSCGTDFWKKKLDFIISAKMGTCVWSQAVISIMRCLFFLSNDWTALNLAAESLSEFAPCFALYKLLVRIR